MPMDKVILGLSGGVDSTVAAVLIHKAIKDNLQCVFVNNGLLRKNEFDNVLDQYKGMGLNVKGVDASDFFISKLKGVDDPELKRKIIGKAFRARLCRIPQPGSRDVGDLPGSAAELHQAL